MREFELSELPAAVGADLGHSRWFTIGQERIDTFADATDDHQWIHVDRERALGGPFRTTIAHGYLTLSLVSAALGDLLRVNGVAMAINYGTDRVRFPQPVPVDSRLRGHGQLVAAVPVEGGIQTTVRVTMQTEGAAKPACVADVLSRFLAP